MRTSVGTRTGYSDYFASGRVFGYLTNKVLRALHLGRWLRQGTASRSRGGGGQWQLATVGRAERVFEDARPGMHALRFLRSYRCSAHHTRHLRGERSHSDWDRRAGVWLVFTNTLAGAVSRGRPAHGTQWHAPLGAGIGTSRLGRVATVTSDVKGPPSLRFTELARSESGQVRSGS